MKTSVGQPTTLYIEAKGNPMPEITWKKDGDPINHPLLLDGSLYIHSTTMSDEGSYTVTASSSEGESSETIELIVLNPQFVPCKSHVTTSNVLMLLWLQPMLTRSQSKWSVLLNTLPCYMPASTNSLVTTMTRLSHKQNTLTMPPS